MTRAAAGADIVIHAAAMKQVPACEYNPFEAVRTNVLGAQHVIDAAIDAGVRQVVALSTDKAVNPSSQMGLTKRIAEIYIHDRAMRHPDSRVSLVRFGNVLGSSGSVVPLFRKQIEAGGPVTVTHPEMTRYLMTVEDAVRLTLAAASLPQNGYALYVLEMGKPVRIIDLAVEMIRHAGKRPFVDIDTPSSASVQARNFTKCYIMHGSTFRRRRLRESVRQRLLSIRDHGYAELMNSWPRRRLVIANGSNALWSRSFRNMRLLKTGKASPAALERGWR